MHLLLSKTVFLCSHLKQSWLCLSFCLFQKEKKNHQPLISLYSQRAALYVCEDSSCILRSRSRGKHLPPSPSSSSSCPHLTLMAVGFLMRKWVSLHRVHGGLAEEGKLEGWAQRNHILVRNASPGCEAQMLT